MPWQLECVKWYSETLIVTNRLLMLPNHPTMYSVDCIAFLIRSAMV